MGYFFVLFVTAELTVLHAGIYVNSDHCTAMTVDQEGNWHYIDDERVTIIQEDEVLTPTKKDSYLLVHTRRENMS